VTAQTELLVLIFQCRNLLPLILQESALEKSLHFNCLRNSTKSTAHCLIRQVTSLGEGLPQDTLKLLTALAGRIAVHYISLLFHSISIIGLRPFCLHNLVITATKL
jgi:hypothetical protein